MRKYIQLSDNNVNYLASIFSISDFDNKLTAWELLKIIQPQVKKLYEGIDSTIAVLEKEGVGPGTFFYESAVNAAKQNVPGAGEVVKQLSGYFPRTGKRGKKK